MDLNTVDIEFINNFRRLKDNSVIEEKNLPDVAKLAKKNIDLVADILMKEVIDDQDQADVIYYLDEMENIVGVGDSIKGYKPIILRHINYMLR